MGTGQPSVLIYKLPAKFWEANSSLVNYWPQIQLCNLPTCSPAPGDLSSSPLAFNFLVLHVKQRTKRGPTAGMAQHLPREGSWATGQAATGTMCVTWWQTWRAVRRRWPRPP